MQDGQQFAALESAQNLLLESAQNLLLESAQNFNKLIQQISSDGWQRIVGRKDENFDEQMLFRNKLPNKNIIGNS